MKSFKLRYKAISIALMVAILPSVLGVHIFQHHCNGCDEDETITRIITTAHTHHHTCDNCSCANSACQSCQELSGQHVHNQHQDESCQHQFKKASIEGQTAQVKFKIEAASVDLFSHTTLVSHWASDITLPTQLYLDVLQKIPDEPSPELNCVFLL